MATVGEVREQLERLLPEVSSAQHRLDASAAEFSSVRVDPAYALRWEIASLPVRKVLEAAKLASERTRSIASVCTAVAARSRETDFGEAQQLLMHLRAAAAESSERSAEAAAAVTTLRRQHELEVAEQRNAGTAALVHLDTCLAAVKTGYSRLDLSGLPPSAVTYPQSGLGRAADKSALDGAAPLAPAGPGTSGAVQEAGAALTAADEARRAVDPAHEHLKDAPELQRYERAVEAAATAVHRAGLVLAQVRREQGGLSRRVCALPTPHSPLLFRRLPTAAMTALPGGRTPSRSSRRRWPS